MESSPPPGSEGVPAEEPSLVDQLVSEALEPQPEEPNGDNSFNVGVAGPSTSRAPGAGVRRKPQRKPKPKNETLYAYTTAWVPGLYNVKNPAGVYVQKESNVDVARQVSQARAKRLKADAVAAAADEEDEEEMQAEIESSNSLTPLSEIIIIHPGSRNLRIGRASDFYPHEIPNCIARPGNAPCRGTDPPVPGSRNRRLARQHDEKDGANGHWVDPMDRSIGYVRDYLKEKLRANRLSTDWREGSRVKSYNAKVKAEPIPEHNDPYRIEWTEAGGQGFFIGEEALRLSPSSGYKVRWPILHRGLNRRDWPNTQTLTDDIATIIEESLVHELGIRQTDFPNYSVILVVPDHGDRFYVQEMTKLLLGVFGFREIAVHQEAYAAIFAAGMSSACVVDIGAQQTSVTWVDEGVLIADSRTSLSYGGDDVTGALVALLQRASFPYKELDLARTQDWLMMDSLKIKLCTLEENLIANTSWDCFVLKTDGLTDKYIFRTYDENIVAPLCFFDTRMIDFDEKLGNGSFSFHPTSDDIEDTLATTYDEPSAAMKACVTHLLPAQPLPEATISATNGDTEDSLRGAKETNIDAGGTADSDGQKSKSELVNGDARDANGTVQAPTDDTNLENGETAIENSDESKAVASTYVPPIDWDEVEFDIVWEASKSPLDGAIAACISKAGMDNKIRNAASSILLIGGSSALKGLNNFIAERLPSLLRAKGLPIQEVSIVPPPRNLNPRFVSWKGACVMCHLESMSDMWIRRDEWEAIGPRALQDRYLFI